MSVSTTPIGDVPPDPIPGFRLRRALRRGAVLLDIRSQARRTRQGTLPGALAIEPNRLVSRCDPTGPERLRLAVDHDVEWIVVCADGVAAATAAAELREFGLRRATHVVGGYRALHGAGLVVAAIGQPHFVREAIGVSAN